VTIILDAGALIAIDRGRRDLLSRLQTAFKNGDLIRTPAGVIGQVWRDGGRQTLLARALHQCEEIPLDGRIARSAGQLCGRTGTSDVVDASVAVAVGESGGRNREVVLLTSDADDLRTLISALNANVRIVEV
jgi:hypothetical protein